MEYYDENTVSEFGHNSRINAINNFFNFVDQIIQHLTIEEALLLQEYMLRQLKGANMSFEAGTYNHILPFETTVFNVGEFLNEILRINPRNANYELINDYRPVKDQLKTAFFDSQEIYLLRNNLNLK